MLANSDLTEHEKKRSLELRKNGSRPVEVDWYPHKPKLESVYEEPEYCPEDDGLEFCVVTLAKRFTKKRSNCCHVMMLSLSDPINRKSWTKTHSGVIVRTNLSNTSWIL